MKVTRRQLDRLREAEDRTHGRTGPLPGARRATSRELQWLLRRAPVRGVTEPLMDENWRPAMSVDPEGAYTPLGYTLERHANAPVLEHDRHLQVDGDEATSHQAMLALGALPETGEFPGGTELLFTPLDALKFPVDAVMHCRFIANRDAVGKTRKRVVDADNAYRDETLSEHGSLSHVADENRTLARELDAYLRSSEHPPLLDATISLAVGAPDPEELERRVEQLRARYGCSPPPPAPRPATAVVPRPSPAVRHGRDPRLRRRPHQGTIRRPHAGRDAPGRVRPRRVHGLHAQRRARGR